MTFDQAIRRAAELVRNGDVIATGAGLSADSGLLALRGSGSL
jgi:NAD-dependent SIR2 family protein deacetylase